MAMRRIFCILFCFVVFTSAAEAKPKKKTYNNSSEQVFLAALRTARERHVVTYVDEKQLMFTFQTGMSVWSYGFVANASVEPESPDRATLVINVQNKQGLSMGAGGRMADKFFKQVSETLAGDVTQKVGVRPEEKAIDVPPPKASTEAPTIATTSGAETTTSGTVILTASADSCEVLIDDAFVGNAPATLKLSPGKHSISVVCAGHKTWNREISVLAGSEVRLIVGPEKESAATSP